MQVRTQEIEARLNKAVMENERLATENRNYASRVSEVDKVRGANR